MILQPHKQSGTTDTLKLKFRAPSANAGLAYALNSCIGPPSNPCGTLTANVVRVPGGEERLAIVPTSVFVSKPARELTFWSWGRVPIDRFPFQ